MFHLRDVLLLGFVVCETVIALSDSRAGEPAVLFAEVSQTHEVVGFSEPLRFAVVRTGDVRQAAQIDLEVGGTATSGLDYRPIDTVVSFAPGERVVRREILPVPDDPIEGPETITIRIRSRDGSSRLVSESGQAITLTIAGELPTPVASLAIRVDQEESAPIQIGDSSRFVRRSNDPGFSEGFVVDEVEVGTHENSWDVAWSWPLTRPIGAGDTMMVGFYAMGKRVEADDASSDSAQLTVRVQTDADPFDGAEQTIDLSGSWKPYVIRLESPATLPAGKSSLSLRVGHGRQLVKVAGLKFFNFGGQPMEHWPRPIFSYEGRAADASWRAGSVLNASVLADKAVGYEFGTAVNYNWVAPTAGEHSRSAEAKRYQDFVKENFDCVTDENAQQWVSWEHDPERAKQTAAWAISNGLKLRGHSVLWGDPVEWPAPPNLWEDYQSVLRRRGTQEAVFWMRGKVAEHVRKNTLVALRGERRSLSVAGDERPIIARWDVLNHPILHDEMWEITGWEFLRAAIREARQLAHPQTDFFVNEDQVLSRQQHENVDSYLRVIRGLLAAEVPIDGIGFQSHFSSNELPSIESIFRKLDRFAATGLQLHVTEFDIDDVFIDEQTQADFTRDFLTLVAAHRAVTSTTVWGFWEKEHWRADEGAAMLQDDFTIRPHGRAMLHHIELIKALRSK